MVKKGSKLIGAAQKRALDVVSKINPSDLVQILNALINEDTDLAQKIALT